ncbi:hypothetical protein Ahy_B09g094959 [Arachis hypogaea]|uniref:Aminotransferase-like plant mobile domain-containing protein n=1 Tax=Arachis hypogaea TaxID=3818 RepID=A0A444XCI7_ARAHY|nr:hypothetical protein Ahy_B09g094959 [Arachis hypogaea]
MVCKDLFVELPPPNKVKQMTVHFTWFHKRFRVLPADATEDTVGIYTRAYIMMLLSTQLFGAKSVNRVHIRWLPFVVNLDDMGRYSWGSAALAWLYRCMCRVANKNVTNLADAGYAVGYPSLPPTYDRDAGPDTGVPATGLPEIVCGGP